MEHWSVEDYKNFANNKEKKSKYGRMVKRCCRDKY